MRIGSYTLDNNLMLAPMAGVTDRPFRQLCKRMGAGLVVSEMLSSNPKVWNTAKSQARMNHEGEEGIRSVQIAGADPELMAQAAQFNVENGAQIIDINMGCPAKKVNKKLAGSALLQYPSTVESIIKAVVNAVDVPVTLKIRTGWNTDNRNGVEIARIAEQNGIQYLLAEIRDDHLSDTYASPIERYWDDDCLEIFIDADGSGGDHFNNYNAFAYHLALDNQVADIGPSMAAENKGEAVPQLYNDHVDSAWKRQSDAPFVVHWETAIKVFADDYVHGESNTPVTLKKGMKLGFMLAYCDADGGDREHFMGSHPITPINGDKNQGYKDASVFDVLELK